jgi:hypothetical protein
MPGHEKAARRPDSERLRADTRKTPLQGERGARPGSRFPGRGCLRRREQHAHEPLIRRPTLAEVPLAGLSLTGGEESTMTGGERQEPADEKWMSGGESRSGTGRRRRAPREVAGCVASGLRDLTGVVRRLGGHVGVCHRLGDCDRGRDGPFGPPPAQIRTCRTTAYGSYLGC